MLSKKHFGFTTIEIVMIIVIVAILIFMFSSISKNNQNKIYSSKVKANYEQINDGLKSLMKSEGVTKLADTRLWRSLPKVKKGINLEVVLRNNKYKNDALKIFNTSNLYSIKNYPKANNMKHKTLNNMELLDVKEGFFLEDGTWVDMYLYGIVKRSYCGKRECLSLNEFQRNHNTKTTIWETVGSIKIDINGVEKPNTDGRDVFMFYIGNDGTLYPVGGKDFAMTQPNCKYDNIDSCELYWKKPVFGCNFTSYGLGCAGRLLESNWQMNY